MKRISSLIAILIIALFALTACGGTAQEATPTMAPEPTEAMAEPTEEPMAEPTEAMSEGLLEGMSMEELMSAGYVVIAPGAPIRIGASVALTGPIPDPGRDIANGAEIAIDDLNEMGGFNGHMFELDLQDGACDGDAGTTVANRFASDPTIVAVSGGTCSGETFGLTPVLQQARIPFVSPSATNPEITSAECDICNRVALSDALQGATDAAYVFNDLGLTTVAVMHDSSDYGLGLAQVFNDDFIAMGGTVVAFEGVQVGDTDFRAPLTNIAANTPELIFFGGYATEAALIATQMKEVGLEDAIFFSDDGSFTQQYLTAAGAAAEGTYASFVAGDDVKELNDAFDAKYMEKYGISPDDLGPFHGQSYDSVRVIADAIARVAKTDDAGEGYLLINREELIKAIRETTEFQGMTGTLTCNEIGECGAGGIQIFQVQNGEFVQVSGFGLE